MTAYIKAILSAHYAFLGETLGKSSIIGGIVILGAIFWVFENTRKEKNT